MMDCGRDLGQLTKVWFKTESYDGWNPEWVRVTNGGKMQQFWCGFWLDVTGDHLHNPEDACEL